jgi:hypothetical protein
MSPATARDGRRWHSGSGKAQPLPCRREPGERADRLWAQGLRRHCGEALKRTCAKVPLPEKQARGRSSAIVPPEQRNSSKHVASMFLGCSLLVPGIPVLLIPPPTPAFLYPRPGYTLQTPEALSRLQPSSSCCHRAWAGRRKDCRGCAKPSRQWPRKRVVLLDWRFQPYRGKAAVNDQRRWRNHPASAASNRRFVPAQPTRLSPCSGARAMKDTHTNPRRSTNHAHDWNSNLRFGAS